MKALIALLFALLPLSVFAQKTGSNPITGFSTAAGSCPVTVGTLTLNVTVSRSSGISPLVVFFDATASTDTATLGGANTVFQDVQFSWSYGDGLASGTGFWQQGSNAGFNSKNASTGAVGAHLFATQGYDLTYNPVVTAFDGTN